MMSTGSCVVPPSINGEKTSSPPRVAPNPESPGRALRHLQPFNGMAERRAQPDRRVGYDRQIIAERSEFTRMIGHGLLFS